MLRSYRLTYSRGRGASRAAPDRLLLPPPLQTDQPLVCCCSSTWSCARSQRCRPASGAALLTSSIKVSVTEPDIPVTSASQEHHGPVSHATIGPIVRPRRGFGCCAAFRLMWAFQGNCDVVWLRADRKTCDYLWLILATDVICVQKLVATATIGAELRLLGLLKRFDECKNSCYIIDFDRDDRCWRQSVTACWVFHCPSWRSGRKRHAVLFLFGLGLNADDVI